MEYQKIKNLLDNTNNHPSKFRIRNSFEVNDDTRRVDNTNSQIQFKTMMLKSILCDYSEYILVKETITIARQRIYTSRR